MKAIILSILTLICLSVQAQDYKIHCKVNGKEVKSRAYVKPTDAVTLTIESTTPAEVWVFKQISLKCLTGGAVVNKSTPITEAHTKSAEVALPAGRYRGKADFTMKAGEFCKEARGTISVKAISVKGNDAKSVNLALYDYILVPTK
jgi:hypothetical protein